MKKIASNFKNMVMVLSGISIFAAIAIASIYDLTKEPIINLVITKEQKAIQLVLPPHDHFDSRPIEMNNGVETTKVYKAYDKDNVFVGAAVESSSNNGYKGNIDIIVGFNNKGIVINYTVLNQNETPGLGAKIVNWFKTDKAKQNILGKNAATANLNISKDGGDIDAISAATISSRAFLFAVRNAYFEFKINLEVPVKETKSKVDTTKVRQNDSISTVNQLKGHNKRKTQE